MDENNQADSKKTRNNSDASTYLSIDGTAKYMYLKANYLENLTEEEKETIDKSGVKDLLAKLSKTKPKYRYAIDSQDTYPFLWKDKHLRPLFNNTIEEKFLVNSSNYRVFVEFKQQSDSLFCKCVYLPKSIFEEIPESEILCGDNFITQEYTKNCSNGLFSGLGVGGSDPFAKTCNDININDDTLQLSGLTKNEERKEVCFLDKELNNELDKELESIRYIGNNFEKNLNIILNKINSRHPKWKFSWHHEGNLIVNQAKTKIMYIHLAKAYEGLNFLLSEKEAQQKISKLLEEILKKVF